MNVLEKFSACRSHQPHGADYGLRELRTTPDADALAK